MKKLFFFLFCLFSLEWFQAQVIYVNPMGNDHAEGSAQHPLQSLHAAQQKARAFRASEKYADKTIIIQMQTGTYFLSRPMVWTPEDAGTEKSPLIIRGEGIGKTILSGGMLLPPFTQEKNGLWSIDMATILPSNGEIQQLFVNGRRALRARTPQNGQFFLTGTVKEVIVDTVPDRGALRRGLAVQQIKLPAEAVDALSKRTVSQPTQLKIEICHKWDETRRYVASISMEDSCVYITGKRMASWNKLGSCSQFAFRDDFSFLDEAGEWFYDTEEAKLYYKPFPHERIEHTQAFLPIAKKLLLFQGNDSADVSFISFENMTFTHTAFPMSWQGSDPQQAASTTSACVEADYASYLTFENCEITQTGNNALWLRLACHDCQVKHCYFHDLGIGAIKIGNISQTEKEKEEHLLTKRITIDNNILRDGGRELLTGEGILMFNASDNVITHNEIADFYYSGMSIGWRWGYEYSPTKRNRIQYNHIHHIGWGALSDMGGIYTLGPSEGTIISHNVIHHIHSLGYGGWGLYTDEGSTGIVMENNWVYACKSSAFHQHYGKENIIRNNVFSGQLRAQMEATRVEEHLSYTFTHNIVSFSQGKMYDMKWDKVNARVDSNLYWYEKGKLTFNGLQLKDWQRQTGKDRASVVANPKYKNGYIPTCTKYLKQIGFQPFDVSQVGVYGDTSWLNLSSYDAKRAELFEQTVKYYEENVPINK